MADVFTDRLGLNKMDPGTHSNEWGEINNIILGRLDIAGRGATQIAIVASQTLDATNITGTGSAAEDEGFFNWIEFTGTPGAEYTITVQAEDMVWRVYNHTDNTQLIKPAGGSTFQMAVGVSYILALMPGDTAFTDLSATLALGITQTGTLTGFTSTGIDDNATAERLQIADTALSMGGSATYSIQHLLNSHSLSISGGSSLTNGAAIIMYGGAHGNTGDMQFLNDGNAFFTWDETLGLLVFNTGVGSKTQALRLTSSQDAVFAGEVVGTGFTGTLDGILGGGTPAAISGTTGAFSGEVTGTGFTGTLDGVLGGGSAASATVTTVVASGVVSVDDTTDTSSGTTGSVHTDGGVGIAKKLYVGTDATVAGNFIYDSLTQPVTKIIDIGDWDMDADASTTVTHGLTFSEIRSAQVTIRNDDNNEYIDITGVSGIAGYAVVNATQLTLSRTGSGTFDNTSYNSTTYNRGWVTIQYVP